MTASYLVYVDGKPAMPDCPLDAVTAASLFVGQARAGRHVEIRVATAEDIEWAANQPGGLDLRNVAEIGGAR